MTSSGSSVEDDKAFADIVVRDPESKKCFECGYPTAPWCDVNHAVFLCLDCSGQHRGLGVHLSFVRSSTMDGWSNWRPEKLRQMQAGGNRKARIFFDAHGVPASPVRARYNSRGALMYKDKLEAEAEGRAFDEVGWAPPEWFERANTQGQQPQADRGAAASRYHGVGSAGSHTAQGGGGGAWVESISSGWSTVAAATTQLASTAAATAATTYQEAQERAPGAAAGAQQAASSAWSAMASWTGAGAQAVSQWADQARQAVNDGGQDGDGLSGLTRNIEKKDGFGHAEHVVSPTTANDDDGLSGLTRNIDNKEGFGHAEHIASPTGDDGLTALTSNLQRSTQYYGGVGPTTAPPPAAASAPVALPSPSPRSSPRSSEKAVAPAPAGWDWSEE